MSAGRGSGRAAAPADRSGSPAELAVVLAPWHGRLVGLDDVAGTAPVAVACSGGADSLALLALVRAVGRTAVAVHVDHGLRPGSARDADVVAAVAAALGAGFVARRVEIPLGAALEARARTARRGALLDAADARGAAVVALGHTGDDQAETVLLNLLRGAATAGLGAMAPARGRWRHPILGLRRADTQEICARLRLAPLHDPMNDDDAFRRVWLRREVLPMLERGAARDLRGVLARQAELLRADGDLLDDQADAALARDGGVPTTAALAALPRPIARRVVRRWLGSPPVPLASVDAVLAVATGACRAAEVPGGRRVTRAGRRLACAVLEPAPPPPPTTLGVPGSVALGVPGSVALGAYRLDARVETVAPSGWPDGLSTCVVDADAAGGSLVVRPPRPGDRFRPLGGTGTKRVAVALAEAGIAAAVRPRHPVVVAGAAGVLAPGEPLWVVGYRVDDRVRVTPRTRRFLWISAS